MYKIFMKHFKKKPENIIELLRPHWLNKHTYYYQQ